MSFCTTTIDDMSDDCIRLVFDCLTLNSELIHMRIVSKRFQVVAEGLLATRQASIRKLKLFPNLGHIHSYVSGLVSHNIQYEPQFMLLEANNPIQKHSAILVGSVDDYSREETIFPQFLPRVFINLTELILVLKLGHNFDLNQFLVPWASQLVSLTLFGNSVGYEPLSVEVISTMSNLRRLNLFNFDLGSIDVPKLAPVLSNLEHLGLYNYIQPKNTLSEFNSSEFFFKALKKARSNNVTPFLLCLTPGVCTSLSLSQVTFSNTELAFLIENRPTLLANLTSLNYTPQENFSFPPKFPLFFPYGLGMTPETLEILSKASLSKLTFLQTCLRENIGSLLCQLPPTFPALVELKLRHFSSDRLFSQIPYILTEHAATSLREHSWGCVNFSIKDPFLLDYLPTHHMRSCISACPALEKITLVVKGTSPWVELYLQTKPLKIDALVADERDLLGHLVDPCAVWRKEAIKAESQRLPNVVRYSEEKNFKQSDISRLGQLKAPLGIYEYKVRLEAVKWNGYQSLQCRKNYCAILKEEIEQLAGKEDAQTREKLKRLLEATEKNGKREEASWKDLVAAVYFTIKAEVFH